MPSAERSTQMFSMRSVQLSCAVVQSSVTRNAGGGRSPSPVQTFEPWAGACGVSLEDWSAQGLSRQHSVFGTDEVFKLLLAIPAWACL